MRQPILDDKGNIIGSYDPDFLENLPDTLYHLVMFHCSHCEAEFLMDLHFVKTRNPTEVSCPLCQDICEAISGTDEEDADFLADLGCAYPNAPTWDERWEWKEKQGKKE